MALLQIYLQWPKVPRAVARILEGSRCVNDNSGSFAEKSMVHSIKMDKFVSFEIRGQHTWRNKMYQKKKVYISFDYHHDHDLKENFVTQFELHGLPLKIVDYSIKEEISENWKKKARERLRQVDFMIVICGQNTHTAAGVSAEITIAQEERIPYYLLAGRQSYSTRPRTARTTDKLHEWKWSYLKQLFQK